MARLEVYFKLREVDNYGSNSKESAIEFVKEISVSGYLDVLKKFYQYAIEIIDFVLNDGCNITLDSYNDGKIDRIFLDKIMECINSAKEILIRDKEDLLSSIQDADEEQKRIDESTSENSSFLDFKF
jgi:hypothetical protein